MDFKLKSIILNKYRLFLHHILLKIDEQIHKFQSRWEMKNEFTDIFTQFTFFPFLSDINDPRRIEH